MRPRRLFTLGVALMCVGANLAADNPPPKSPASKTLSSAKKKEYELPKTGKNIPRQKDGWINVEGSGRRFVIKFFDKEKKPVAPDVERGLALFNYAAKNDTRAPLHLEGDTLVTPATVKPPHNFLITLRLFAGEAEPAETYTFKYP